MFWSWLASFLSGPLLNNLVTAYKARLEAGNTAEQIAADLAGKELLLQQRENELQTQYKIAELGRWWEPDKLMAYFVAIYFGKLLIWDKVLALGTTDGLEGWAATTANLIVGFYFGRRTFENVARIIKR